MNALMRGLIATVIVLAQPISSANAATYLFHNDHLGTPQALTDSDQQVVWQSAQDPFGEVTEVTNQVEQNFRFPGQYFDVETGLHYNYFRDYDSSIGRYSQSDPLGLYDGPSTYGYAYQSPFVNIDPTGLAVCGGICVGTIFTVGGRFLMSQAAKKAAQRAARATVAATIANSGDGGGDPCRGLREQLKEHQKKLREYSSNPYANDNKGFLANSPAKRHSNIINGRIRNLEGQIENFRKQLEKCEENNSMCE